MTNVKRRGRRLIFFAAAILMTASVVGAAVFSKLRQAPTDKKRVTTLKAEFVTKPPAISSKVKNLEVAGVAIVRQGTPRAAVAIQIINNSDLPVMALDISSGDSNDFSSLGLDGLDDPDNPEVLIPPHSLKTIEWELGAILDGYPVVISAASFANGVEDGEPRALEIMHRDRERAKAKRDAARKEAPK
jgi:hypothetical protein